MVVALLMIIRAVLSHRVGWNVVVWATAVVTTLLVWPISSDPLNGKLTQLWAWQIILVGIGMALAIGPLQRMVKGATKEPDPVPEPLDTPTPVLT